MLRVDKSSFLASCQVGKFNSELAGEDVTNDTFLFILDFSSHLELYDRKSLKAQLLLLKGVI